jgi:hypothetical protein
MFSLPDSAQPESLQKFTGIRAHLGFRVIRRVIGNRPTYKFVYRGVNRMAWTLPSSGPLRTIAMAAICPCSLILLAMVGRV